MVEPSSGRAAEVTALGWGEGARPHDAPAPARPIASQIQPTDRGRAADRHSTSLDTGTARPGLGLQENYGCSRSTTDIGDSVAGRRLTPLEMQIMEAMWDRGAVSIRDIQEAFPAVDRPAYTTVQTVVYRLESKKA